MKKGHLYKGSCSQAPETPNCPLAAGKPSTHETEDSLRWKIAQEGTEASLLLKFGDFQQNAGFSTHKAHRDSRCHHVLSFYTVPQAGGDCTPEDTAREKVGQHCTVDHHAVLVYSRHVQGIDPKISELYSCL